MKLKTEDNPESQQIIDLFTKLIGEEFEPKFNKIEYEMDFGSIAILVNIGYN